MSGFPTIELVASAEEYRETFLQALAEFRGSAAQT